MDEKLPGRSEHKLIFKMLGSDPGNGRTAALLKGELDWDYVYRTSEEHSIIPILFKNLSALPSNSLPPGVLEKFQIRYKAIATYNFARSTQLIKLVEQLETNGVPVIAYKGMALAAYAYQDTTMRQFGDIDLFIRKADFARAKTLLGRIDCKPAWQLNERQEKGVLRYYYEYPFFYGENKTLVEVHWEWVESFFTFDFEFEGIWERTEKVDLYGKKITTLSAEDYLVVLCSHGSKHFWKRLSWICDVAKLIENKKIDWDTVIERSSKYGALRMVWIGVNLAREVCGTKLPAKISQMIDADKNATAFTNRFLGNVFEDEREPSEWTEMARTHLGMREKISSKLKYSYRLLTTKAIDSLFLPMGRPR